MVMVNKAFKNKERDYGNYNFFIFKIDFLSLIQWVLKKNTKIIIMVNLELDRLC